MLVIRTEQIDVFSRALMDDFVRRMAEHLETDFPTEVARLNLEKPQLIGFVREGIEQAKRYAIEYEADLQLYVDCLVTLGPDFAQKPWAAAILNDYFKSGEDKMAEISEYMLFGLPERK